jgi:hypothetical protein
MVLSIAELDAHYQRWKCFSSIYLSLMEQQNLVFMIKQLMASNLLNHLTFPVKSLVNICQGNADVFFRLHETRYEV